MNNPPIPFVFNDSLVRLVVDEQGSPWFVAKDVCSVLELSNPSEATRALDEDEKITLSNTEGNPRAGIPHQMTLISESGLYALIFRSRKAEAKRFRKWVTAEVLPTLRKSGGYICEETTEYLEENAALPTGLFSLDATSLPPEVQGLNPRMRERCLGLAMQAARIAGVSHLPSVHALFVDYCHLLAINNASKQSATYEWDSVTDFVTECCQHVGEKQYILLNSLYSAYENWCMRNNEQGQVASKNAFMRVLPKVATFCSISRPRVKQSRPWIVRGVQLVRSAKGV